jgi:hypothetical protein
MKNALLLAFLAVSINIFAQSSGLFYGSYFPVANSTQNFHPGLVQEYLTATRLLAEQHSVLGDNYQIKDKKWSVSMFAGFSVMGPGQEIKDQMSLQFGDTRPAFDGWFFGSVPAAAHPQHTSYPIWNFEIGYRVFKKNSLSLNYGQLTNTLTEGHDHEDSLYAWEGNNLNLRSDLAAISLLYIYDIGWINDELSIGPVIGFYKIYDSDVDNSGSNKAEIKPGVQLGYAIAFIHGRSFFLKLKANYTWLPNATIGPYSKQMAWTSGINQTSVFEETKVSLSTLGLGLSVGWRL